MKLHISGEPPKDRCDLTDPPSIWNLVMDEHQFGTPGSVGEAITAAQKAAADLRRIVGHEKR